MRSVNCIQLEWSALYFDNNITTYKKDQTIPSIVAKLSKLLNSNNSKIMLQNVLNKLKIMAEGLSQYFKTHNT